MEPQIILPLLGILSSFGSAAFVIIKGILDSKRKEQEYDRSQRVNKQDWITWLAEAKKEVEDLKKEIKDMADKHRQEMNDKDSLVSRLQRQVNDQAEEILELQRELQHWKNNFPERKDKIKEEVRKDLPDFMK